MTRKEEITKAARGYVSGVILSSPSDVVHFENGAKWADEHPINVWHSTNEEPILNQWFLAQIGDNAFDTFVMEMDKNEDWINWSKGINIKRWSYINDLLPKQFGNSKQLKGE